VTHLVLTLLGSDRPGLVELVAGIVSAHGGNWLESRMTRLGGQFAGILRAELPEAQVKPALAAFAELEQRGLKVVATSAPDESVATTAAASQPRVMDLELVGLDRPGIVREISQLLAAGGINVEELVTERKSAPMSAEMLFEARAHVRVPAGTDVASLRASLERLASDLMVEIRLEERR
jgi:glycine cleavage system regulatory protein